MIFIKSISDLVLKNFVELLFGRVLPKVYFLQQYFLSPFLQGHGQSLAHSQPVPQAVVQGQSVKVITLVTLNFKLGHNFTHFVHIFRKSFLTRLCYFSLFVSLLNWFRSERRLKYEFALVSSDIYITHNCQFLVVTRASS